MKRFRPRLTYANVIASLALFIALGGAAVAAGLPKNSVGPNQLKKGAVTAKAIRKRAVTSGKIAPKAVIAGKLGPNAVLPGNLGAGIIDTDKIAASAVTAEKIDQEQRRHHQQTDQRRGDVAKLAENGVDTDEPRRKRGDRSETRQSLGHAEKLAPEVLNNVNPLKTGQTLRGVFDIGGTDSRRQKRPPPAARSASSSRWPPRRCDVRRKKARPTPNCPGLGGGETTPEAAAGNLCIYLTDGNQPRTDRRR